MAPDSTLAKIAAYERSDLPERQKAALRLADAYLANPTGIGVELRDSLRAQYTDAELVELLLDLTSWTQQKWRVALGTAEPVDENHLRQLTFDVGGRPVYGGVVTG